MLSRLKADLADLLALGFLERELLLLVAMYLVEQGTMLGLGGKINGLVDPAALSIDDVKEMGTLWLALMLKPLS